MTHNITKILIAAMTLSYIVIASIGCSPMAVATCSVLDVIGVDSQIALADVDGKDSYGHVYVIIDGKPHEPRYLGLYLQDNIRYDDPYGVYDSVEAYTNKYTVFPDIVTIIDAIMEM